MESGLRAMHAKRHSNRNDVLKLIAIITMLIDHLGYIFFPEYSIFRTIGRIAFPIFAYQLAIGYKYTSDLGKYSLRLLIFALISYLPYVYFNPEIIPNFLAFNVIFLLLMGIIAIKIWRVSIDVFTYYKRHGGLNNLIIGLLSMLVFIIYILGPRILTIYFEKVSLSFLVHPVDLRLSYGTYGLLLIMIFYWFEKRPLLGLFSFIIMTFATSFIDAAYHLCCAYSIIDPLERLITIWYTMITQAHFVAVNMRDNMGLFTLEYLFFQARAIIGVMLIYLIKALPFNFKMNKYITYVFYPLHITIIIGIHYIISKG